MRFPAAFGRSLWPALRCRACPAKPRWPCPLLTWARDFLGHLPGIIEAAHLPAGATNEAPRSTANRFSSTCEQQYR
jgi:hypothetical protein